VVKNCFSANKLRVQMKDIASRARMTSGNVFCASVDNSELLVVSCRRLKERDRIRTRILVASARKVKEKKRVSQTTSAKKQKTKKKEKKEGRKEREEEMGERVVRDDGRRGGRERAWPGWRARAKYRTRISA